MSKRFHAISLGQGQGPRATTMVETGMQKGEWILLQNCHLMYVYSWVQYGNCRTQTLNPLENIWFLHAPSIWLKISYGDLSKSGESK